VIWGSTYLGIRFAIQTLPPFSMASIRFLLAGIPLFLVSVRRGDRGADPIGRRQWLSALVVGGLLLAGGNGGVTWAEQYVPSGLAALLVASVPIWIVLISHLLGDERITWPVGVGLAIGLLGVALLVRPHGGQGALLGSLALLAAPFSWALGSVISRRVRLPRRPLVATGMEMTCGGVLLGVVAVLNGDLARIHLERVSLLSALSLLYLVVFGSLVAFSCYVWLLKVARPSVVGTYAYVNPVVAVALGTVFAGEHFDAVEILAGGLIVVAVALVVSARSLRLPGWLRRSEAAVATTQ
jgi:drug/metabolite transporter (DMT)-like permease